MGSGLLIWTIVPEGRMEREFIIDREFSLFSEKTNCIEIQNLLSTEFTVNYPRSIHFGESGVARVDIEKVETDENKSENNIELEPCGISLEVWMEGDGVVAEPGNKIIKPYLNVPSQFIKFEIFPMIDQAIKGTLWINAVFPGDTGSVLETIPIFAVPYAIQVHSIFGLPARSMRILAISLIVLVLFN
jgi:hypothetical protein